MKRIFFSAVSLRRKVLIGVGTASTFILGSVEGHRYMESLEHKHYEDHCERWCVYKPFGNEMTTWNGNGCNKVIYRGMWSKDPRIVRVLQQEDENGRSLAIPEGETVIYKLARLTPDAQSSSPWAYVTLRIPSSAKRTTIYNSDQVRVDRAKVVKIVDGEGNPQHRARSLLHKRHITYVLDEWVYPHSFNEDPAERSSAGIYGHTHLDLCDKWRHLCR